MSCALVGLFQVKANTFKKCILVDLTIWGLAYFFKGGGVLFSVSSF